MNLYAKHTNPETLYGYEQYMSFGMEAASTAIEISLQKIPKIQSKSKSLDFRDFSFKYEDEEFRNKMVKLSPYFSSLLPFANTEKFDALISELYEEILKKINEIIIKTAVNDDTPEKTFNLFNEIFNKLDHRMIVEWALDVWSEHPDRLYYTDGNVISSSEFTISNVPAIIADIVEYGEHNLEYYNWITNRIHDWLKQRVQVQVRMDSTNPEYILIAGDIKV